MWSSSELADGFEPHALIHSWLQLLSAAVLTTGVAGWVYPGWYREGAIPGTNPAVISLRTDVN